MKRVLLLVVAALISVVANGAIAQSAISITDDAVTNRHSTDANSWRWRVAPVKQSAQHFELRYGTADQDWDRWQLVARVGPPVDGVFPVEFFVPNGNANEQAVTSARQQLDYYLMGLGARDPWEYAVYHSTTLSNLYSRVHWLLIQPESRG